MVRSLFLSLLLFIPLFSAGQTATLNVFFESNSDELTKKAKLSLDSLLKIYMRQGLMYRWELAGHTDNIGSRAENKELSLKRARNVAAYLKSKGIDSTDIFIKAVADLDPLAPNTDESGRLWNRRVELELNAWTSYLNERSKLKVKHETASFYSGEGGKLRHPSGTAVYIPPGALVNKDGTLYKGNVRLEYREFRDAADYLGSDIPMVYDSAQVRHRFGEGVMFEIKAYDIRGNELAVAKGTNIRLELANPDRYNGYQSYKYDLKAGRWMAMVALNGQLVEFYVSTAGPICGTRNIFQYELLDTCGRLKMIGMMGASLYKMASELKAGLENPQSLPEQVQIIKGYKVNKDTLEFEERYASNGYAGVYRIDTIPAAEQDRKYFPVQLKKKEKELRGKVEIAVQDKSGTMTEMNTLRDMRFIYDGKNARILTGKDFSKKWSDARLLYDEKQDRFSFQLKNPDGFLTFPVEVIHEGLSLTREDAAQRNSAIYSMYMEDLAKREKAFNDSLARRYQDKAFGVAGKTVVPAKVEKPRWSLLLKDSADGSYRFLWEKSVPLMSVKERALSYPHWIKYFEQNLETMGARYNNVFNKVDEVCFDLLALTYADRLKDPAVHKSSEHGVSSTLGYQKSKWERIPIHEDPGNKNAQPFDPASTISVPVDHFGSYYIGRLVIWHETITINVTYKDEAGNLIRPKSAICVYSDKYQPIISNPSRIVVDRDGLKKVVLMTAAGEIYIVTELAGPWQHGGKYTFTVTNISKKIKDKKALAEHLGIME